jgi:Tfp pilus assembly protein PilF
MRSFLKIRKTILTALFTSTLLVSGQAHAQLESRPTPMWAGIEKTAADIENDKKLVAQALELTNGDKQAAATTMVQLGWQKIGSGDPNGAVRYFNQAWLIKPDFGHIFWGFAVAGHIRGDDLEKIEGWFDTAFKTIKNSPRILSDRGRVLEERKQPEKAQTWFEQALAIDENYLPAHVGMVKIARALKDKELEDKHKKRHDEIVKKADE